MWALSGEQACLNGSPQICREAKSNYRNAVNAVSSQLCTLEKKRNSNKNINQWNIVDTDWERQALEKDRSSCSQLDKLVAFISGQTAFWQTEGGTDAWTRYVGVIGFSMKSNVKSN